MSKKVKRLSAQAGCVTYLRTSDEDAQAPERSQGAQRRDIQQRLLRTYTIPDLGEYVDNFTGTSSDRKHYQRLLTDARLGKFSHVFAATPDRFGRDDVEALRAIDEMTRLGIIVRFASHPDLDPADADDRLYLNILFGMAKRESAITAQRSRGGMLSKLLGGGWSWHAPDGYLNREVRLNQVGPEEQLKHAQYKRWIEIDPEQAKVWRCAWQLLLTDRYTLDEVCEELHKRGYKLANGKPFVLQKHSGSQPGGKGKRIHYFQVLSRVFHNWFYAGWVVVQNDWANIPPKTARGEWEPMISTEEFERGLAILARRRQIPMPVKKNFYLLKGMVYLELYFGKVHKLSCAKPNPNRTQNGVAYYCITRSRHNYPCHEIDAQLEAHIRSLQVDLVVIPTIRKTYMADVSRYTTDDTNYRKTLETRIKKLEEKELNMWRAFTDHGMKADFFEALSREIQEERQRLKAMIANLESEQADHVTNLDAALNIIRQIGDRFAKCEPEQQRAILLQMVERIIIDRSGRIKTIEWKSPFCYLHQIANTTTGSPVEKAKKARDAVATASEPSSFHIALLAPGGT